MAIDDTVRIRHMIDAANSAIGFCLGMDEAAFRGDERTYRAVIQCIEVIGEAANTVTEATKSEITDVPWVAIIGMRHRIVHAYFDIDLSLVWQVVAKDLQPLVDALSEWIGR